MNKAIVYGIPLCESVKKARAWLDAHRQPHEFHDFKKQGVPEDRLRHWIEVCGWETVLNRKGTTWRKLDAATQSSVTDAASACQLMQQHASSIKRPVIEWPSGAITIGHTPDRWPA